MAHIEYVDSDYRKSGTSSNFLYDLPPRDFDSVAVISANVPKSYYLIQSVNNTITFTENGTPRTLTVPAGNYSVYDFITVLKSLLNTGALVYDITYNKYTAKLTFTATGGTFNSLSFPANSSLYRQAGFDYDSVNPVTGNSLTSKNVVLFQLTNIIFIRSDLHESTGSSLGGNILQSITAINNPSMSSITYQNSTDPNLIRKKNAKKSTVNFYITDSDGYVLDLGGSPINIEILFFNYDDSANILKAKAYIDNLERLNVNDTQR